METPRHVLRCKLCGASETAVRYHLQVYDLRVLRCKQCGFQFVDFYNAVSHTAMETGWDYAAHAAGLHKKFMRYCDDIARFCPISGLRVLDVGAGGGDFLAEMKRRGASVLGVDLDGSGVAFAKTRFGIDILQVRIEELEGDDGSFDAIAMWEVIEHVNDPRETVRAVARHLKPGGWFFLSTPCRDSAWDRTASFLYRVSFGIVQFPLTLRYSWTHLQIFSLSEMRRLLGENGFGVVHMEKRTELTYPVEEYLVRIRPAFLRTMLAGIWNAVDRILPIGNKMIVYARKATGEPAPTAERIPKERVPAERHG